MGLDTSKLLRLPFPLEVYCREELKSGAPMIVVSTRMKEIVAVNSLFMRVFWYKKKNFLIGKRATKIFPTKQENGENTQLAIQRELKWKGKEITEKVEFNLSLYRSDKLLVASKLTCGIVKLVDHEIYILATIQPIDSEFYLFALTKGEIEAEAVTAEEKLPTKQENSQPKAVERTRKPYSASPLVLNNEEDKRRTRDLSELMTPKKTRDMTIVNPEWKLKMKVQELKAICGFVNDADEFRAISDTLADLNKDVKLWSEEKMRILRKAWDVIESNREKYVRESEELEEDLFKRVVCIESWVSKIENAERAGIRRQKTHKTAMESVDEISDMFKKVHEEVKGLIETVGAI